MNDKCFAQRPGGVCIAAIGVCPGYGACPFYKTKRQHREGRRQANGRIRRLPAEIQAKIANKYYDGDMPWRGEIG